MPPAWLAVLAWVVLMVAVAAAAEIAYDLFGRGYRQKMPVMAAVWPVTALYFGPVASWAYRRFGRSKSQRWQRERGLDQPPDMPRWAVVAIGVSHCGAGCTLGDMVAEGAVFFLGATIAG